MIEGEGVYHFNNTYKVRVREIMFVTNRTECMCQAMSLNA